LIWIKGASFRADIFEMKYSMAGRPAWEIRRTIETGRSGSGGCRPVCDVSAAPYLNLAGSRMLHELHTEFAGRGITLRIIGAHGAVRDLLRADGVEEKVGGLDRPATLDGVLCPS